MKSLGTTTQLLLAALMLSVPGAVATTVHAQSAGSTIYGCVDNSKGTLRIVTQAGLCDPRKESPLSWSAGGNEGSPVSHIIVVPLPQVKSDTTAAACTSGQAVDQSFSDPVHLDAGVYRLSLGGMHTLRTMSANGEEALGGGRYTVDVRTGTDDSTRLALIEFDQFVGQKNDTYSSESRSSVFQFAGGTVAVKSTAEVGGCALVQANGIAYIEKVD